MADCWVRIADLTLRLSGDTVFTSEGLPGAYQPFLVETGQEDCVLRLELGFSPGWREPARQEGAFSSGDVWAAYRWKGGWEFVCPAARAAPGKRLLRWVPAEQRACLWLDLPEMPSDPLGDLTLPFFAELYARHAGILLHGAAVEVAGRAWVFVGPSGSGKSHWACLWRGQGVPVLDEDRLVLRELGGQIWAFGTPWHAEPRLSTPRGVPVGRLCFLQQAAPDQVLPVRPARAAALLLRSAFLPMYDPAAMGSVLDVAGKTATQAQSFSLGRTSGPQLLRRLLDL